MVADHADRPEGGGTVEAVDSVQAWLKDEAARSELSVTRMDPSDSSQWSSDEEGRLAHTSGGFFRVVGVEYDDPLGPGPRVQPILDQEEVGTLCFLTARSGGEWWLLVQAKVEPGNVNGAQVAPTVQATRSNYRAIHGGKAVPYLDLAHTRQSVLYDGLQSEQNGCFLGKRNLNRVVQLDRRVPAVDSSFRWMPLPKVLSLLRKSHVVNTDARSVIACWLLSQPGVLDGQLEPGSLTSGIIDSLRAAGCRHRTADLENWLEGLNRRWPQQRREHGLTRLGPQWAWTDGILRSAGDDLLEVRHVAVRCRTREVTRWDQPILGTRSEGRIATIVGRIDGVHHLLAQARLEAGNRDGFELTTTIQAGSEGSMNEPERLYEETLRHGCDEVARFDNSDEGGRFDHCISRYSVSLAESAEDVPESPFHRWVSIGQLARWVSRPNRLTNELRSTLSAILSVGS